MSGVDILVSSANQLKEHYWPLIKSRQTFLLALTGIAGYLSQRPVPMDWPRFAGLVGSLLITIGGCTVLNMVFDRDIDQKMARTRQRPLAAMQVNVQTAAWLGSVLIILGLAWALTLSVLYFALALAGVGLDVLVYTIWLKRRSAWSILWGGLSGGIPILASRALVISHNLTLSMLYSEDYLNASLPTFLNVYGLATTRATVVLSSLFSIILMMAAFVRLNLSLPLFTVFGVSSLGLVGMAVYVWASSSRQAVAALYKYSSFYMLAAMVFLLLAALK
jgi:protoheme IX farnesyltransferase